MTFLFPVKNQQGTMEGKPSAPARVSMFRRLMVRVTPGEWLVGDGGIKDDKPPAASGGAEAEVGSVGLDKMVISFMEESSAAVERPPRGRCSNCFNGNQDDISDDDEDYGFLPSASAPATAAPAAAGDALELKLLKGLVQCATTTERNLLADTSRIAERCGKGSGSGSWRKKADVRRGVADGLRALGYDAAVCTSRWEKTASLPSGDHEYIDVVLVESGSGGRHRLVVELDFRSEFEVVRPTKVYRAALQVLPRLFVGTPERLGQAVAVVAEAARQSLKKRELCFPPWRKHEYMRAKWLSPHARSGGDADKAPALATPISAANFSGEFELRFDEKPKAANDDDIHDGGEDKKITVVVSPTPSPWLNPQPPQAKRKVVTGLASLLLLAS